MKIKETKLSKNFHIRLPKVVTQIKLLGEELRDQRVMGKILVVFS